MAFGEDRKKAAEAFNLVKVKYNEVKGAHGEHGLDTLELGLALVEMYIYRVIFSSHIFYFLSDRCLRS